MTIAANGALNAKIATFWTETRDASTAHGSGRGCAPAVTGKAVLSANDATYGLLTRRVSVLETHSVKFDLVIINKIMVKTKKESISNEV